MINKRLIAFAPEANQHIRNNVLCQCLGLAVNVLATCLLCQAAIQVLETGRMPLFCILLPVLVLVRYGLTRMAADQSHASSQAIKKKMRRALLDKYAAMASGPECGFTTAGKTQLATEGIDQLETYFANYLPQFFYAMAAPVLLFAIVAFWDLKSALVLLVCVPLIPASIIAVQKIAKKLLAKYWGQYTALSDSFLENLNGLTTMKVYGTDDLKHAEMNREAEQFRKVTMRVLVMQLNSISVMDLVAYGGSALGMAVALLAWHAGSMTLFQMLAVILLSAEFFLPMRLLGSYFHVSMNGSQAAQRMFAILDTELPERKKQPRDTAPVILQQITYAYPGGKKALQDVTIPFDGTGFYGIAGKSGSGKSTLASVLAGQLAPQQGTAQMAGTDLHEIDPAWMAAHVVVLDHDSRLFAGTVRSNLSGSEDKMEDCLVRAGLWDWLKVRGGLDFELEEEGRNLSGGQRQRLALARALASPASVLILDEATSAMDAELERAMMREIGREAGHRLVICISHRMANLYPAKKIFMMQDGRIAESGTHAELLAKNGLYARMHERQQTLEQYSEGRIHA